MDDQIVKSSLITEYDWIERPLLWDDRDTRRYGDQGVQLLLLRISTGAEACQIQLRRQIESAVGENNQNWNILSNTIMEE